MSRKIMTDLSQQKKQDQGSTQCPVLDVVLNHVLKVSEQ